MRAGPDTDAGTGAARDAGGVGAAGARGVAEEGFVGGAGEGIADARGASDACTGVGGGTAEGAWRCDAAPDGEVGPDAFTGSPELEDLAGRKVDRAPRFDGTDGAIGRLHLGTGVGAGDGDGEMGECLEDLAAAGELEDGCRVGVPEETIGPVEGGGIKGTARGDTEAGEAGRPASCTPRMAPVDFTRSQPSDGVTHRVGSNPGVPESSEAAKRT